MPAVRIDLPQTQTPEGPEVGLNIKVIEVSRTALAKRGIKLEQNSAISGEQVGNKNFASSSEPHAVIAGDGPAVRQIEAWLADPRTRPLTYSDETVWIPTSPNGVDYWGGRCLHLPTYYSLDGRYSLRDDQPKAEWKGVASIQVSVRLHADGRLRLDVAEPLKLPVINGQVIPAMGERRTLNGTIAHPKQHFLLAGMTKQETIEPDRGLRGMFTREYVERTELLILISPCALPPVPKPIPGVLVAGTVEVDETALVEQAVAIEGEAKYTGPEHRVQVKLIELSPEPLGRNDYLMVSSLRDHFECVREFRSCYFPTRRAGPGDPLFMELSKRLTAPRPKKARIVRQQTFTTQNGTTAAAKLFDDYQPFTINDSGVVGSKYDDRIVPVVSFDVKQETPERIQFRCHYFQQPPPSNIPWLNERRSLSFDAPLRPGQSVVVAGMRRLRLVEPNKLVEFFTQEKQSEGYERTEFVLIFTPEPIADEEPGKRP